MGQGRDESGRFLPRGERESFPVPETAGLSSAEAAEVTEPPASGAKVTIRRPSSGGGKKRRRSGKSSRATRPAPSSREIEANREKLLEEIRSSLGDNLTKAGGAMLPVMPLPGMYVMRTGDEAAAIVTRIASRNDALLIRLAQGSDLADYMALGMWTAGLGISVAVNLGRVPADGMLARQWEIDRDVTTLEEEQEKVNRERPSEPPEPGAPSPAAAPVLRGEPAESSMGGSPNGAPVDVETGSAL